MSLRTRLGAYLLTDVIGQGGMAVVYRAKREGWSGFEKTVVVKAMLPSLARDREHVERFIAEAKISAQLNHPGIAQVHDFGVFAGTPYLVMEHVDGVNLSQLLNLLAPTGRRVPVPVALVIATQMCAALGYAHAFCDATGARRQVIHSDVSPSNVMVGRDGTVKLLDFGVAKMIDACDYDTSITVRGKYPYMAPEQINGLPVDRRVDVFAAGIVLHELLTGRRLFAAATELETLRRVDACDVPPPSRLNPEVPPALDAVVLRALARDPADRYDSGDELAAALTGLELKSGGRRRVAELLAAVLPAEAASPSEPSTEKVRLEQLLDEALAPEIVLEVARPRRATLTGALALAGALGILATIALLRWHRPITHQAIIYSQPRIQRQLTNEYQAHTPMIKIPPLRVRHVKKANPPILKKSVRDGALVDPFADE